METTHSNPAAAPRERAAGWLLVGGSVLGLVAMAAHPSGRDLLRSPDRAAAVLRDQIVHGVAIAAVWAEVAGSLAFVRRLRGASIGAAETGFVALLLAAVAATIAALASGFIAPGLIDGQSAADPGERAAYAALWRFNHVVNQAAARLYVVGSAAALLLWGGPWWRHGRRGLGGLGIVLGLVGAVLVCAGWLHLGVHGMGAVVLGQGVFFVMTGRELLRPPAG